MPSDHEFVPTRLHEVAPDDRPADEGAANEIARREQNAIARFAERERADELRPRPITRRASLLRTLDGFLFAFAGLAAIWLGYLLVRYGVRANWQALLLIVFWILFTYLLLPRLHRILTNLYVPGYFIGRARTSDGLLGDPVNIGIYAHEAQIHRAMAGAGWNRADDLTPASGRRIVTSTLTRRSYPQAPVSPLLLFDRQQDFAYQQEVAGNPAKRHHVRFWRCPEGWMLPGGYPMDWLAAGTYDRAVGLSLFTLQITHKIAADTDIERDFIVDTVRETAPEAGLKMIDNFSTGYHARNGGGDLIETDGHLPILDLQAIEAEEIPAPEMTDSRRKRPSQTTFGSVMAILRGVGFLLLAALAAAALAFAVRHPGQLTPDMVTSSLISGDPATVLVVVVVYLATFGVLDVVLGIATYRGTNWGRILVMLTAVVSTVVAFVSNALVQCRLVTLGTLPGVAAEILVLLALSSHRARAFAEQPRPAAKEISAETAAGARGH